MASPTWCTWVLASSRSWWWTGKLVCCSSWGPKESDMTERLNWTERVACDWTTNAFLSRTLLHASLLKIIQWYPESVLGMTYTPWPRPPCPGSAVFPALLMTCVPAPFWVLPRHPCPHVLLSLCSATPSFPVNSLTSLQVHKVPRADPQLTEHTAESHPQSQPSVQLMGNVWNFIWNV